jgi:hypothetical protein
MEFRDDITPGDYLLINDLDSMYIIAYSKVDKYEIAPFIVWVFDDKVFGCSMTDCATYEVQKYGRKIEYLREWPKTWAWTIWRNPRYEKKN